MRSHHLLIFDLMERTCSSADGTLAPVNLFSARLVTDLHWMTTSQHFRQCAWVRRAVPVGRTQAQFMWPHAGLGLALGLLNHSQLLKQKEQNVPLLPAWFNTITWARRCWMQPFGFGPAVLRRCNKHTNADINVRTRAELWAPRASLCAHHYTSDWYWRVNCPGTSSSSADQFQQRWGSEIQALIYSLVLSPCSLVYSKPH